MVIRAAFRFVLGLSALISMPTGYAADTCTPIVAKIVSVQGEVTVIRSGDPRPFPVRLEETLCVGDKVWVDMRSRARIWIPANQTNLTLDQGTMLTFLAVAPDKPSWLELIKGAVHFISRVPNTLNVRTPFVSAGIEGTEFVLRVGTEDAALWVFEGQVRFRNAAGSLRVKSGEAAVVEVGRAPIRRLMIKPRAAVNWALYYPPLIDFRTVAYPSGPTSQALQEALALYRDGDLSKAFERLDKVPVRLRDKGYLNLRAGLLLLVGRVDEAQADIKQALDQAPNNGTGYALQSIIDVVQGEDQSALYLARKAAQLEPKSPVPQVALSYAYQALFDMENAFGSIQKAVDLAPNDALARARLAELELSRGNMRPALDAAKKAVALDPRLARTQTVLGFAHLTQFKVNDALAAFKRAITLDPAAPLPRLGLGLAIIRDGDLTKGTEEVQTAASLDPDNSLIRSYLGKAYFEQRRGALADTEFDNAKELDPNDPTPWFYDAILKQSTNRPVAALHSLQKSIKLNDNRAVYRSRLLLDQDLAVRGASLAPIYTNLGFDQLALVEASKSVSLNPASYSAHRFMADAYARKPRHEVGRVSELFQAQLLQPININPVQPQLATTDANIGMQAAFNEFTPLFETERPRLLVTGLLGNNDTYADEAVVSGLYGPLSYSLSQLHFQSDGFRDNNDLDQDLYDVFAQVAVTPRFNIQMEVQRRETDQGDLNLTIERPDDNIVRSELVRGELTQHFGRVGVRFAPSPRSDLVGSVIYSDRDTMQKGESNFFDYKFQEKERGYQAEAQYLFRSDRFNVTAGGGVTQIDVDERFELTFPDFNFPLSQEKREIDQENAYFYSNVVFPSSLTWTLGLGLDAIDNDRGLDLTKLNPKVGLQWNITDSIRLRAAWFETLKRQFIADRTLEPTQVAGFNQFFDDIAGTDATRYGIGLDARFTDNLYGGVEASRRDLEVPFSFFGNGTEFEDRDEELYLGYLYWTPHPEWALSVEYRHENLKRRNDLGFSNLPEDIETMSVPLTARYFNPSGLFAGLGVTYVDQDVKLSSTDSNSDDFFVLDTAIGYRLPKRWGIISLEARNLLNETFQFQEENLQPEFFARQFIQTSRPTDPRFIPDRTLLLRFTLSF